MPRDPSYAPAKELTASRADQSSSEIWFKKVDKLNGLLRALTAERDAEYDRQRVKIAVVDTGISPQDLYSQYMKEGMYKDFVDGEDTVKRDDVGHGTNTVNLIFKVFEFPDIFVARVFKTTLASDDTPRFVKQARPPCVTDESFSSKLICIRLFSGLERRRRST